MSYNNKVVEQKTSKHIPSVFNKPQTQHEYHRVWNIGEGKYLATHGDGNGTIITPDGKTYGISPDTLKPFTHLLISRLLMNNAYTADTQITNSNSSWSDIVPAINNEVNKLT